MSRTLACLALAASALALQAPAQAWSASGHMVVAGVAYRHLDAGAKKRVGVILRSHPHFSKWKAGIASAGVPVEEYLLMQAAVWPDTVRDEPRYHRPTWHYINKPYAPTNMPFDAPTENVLTALDLNKKRFIEPTSSLADKAVALSWVLHLSGDLHQPLHSVALVDADYPTGDRGGNDFYVRTPSGPQNLHRFWDGQFEEARTPKEADALAVKLVRSRPKASLPELDTRTPDGWVQESYRLAVTAGYRHIPDPNRPFERVPLATAKTPEAAQALPEGYAANARANSERRVVLAGYRLGTAVNGLFYGQP